MGTLPKFASNLKYWRILNCLVFGGIGRCHKANRSLLQRVSATVAQIRRLRLEAQSLAQQPDEEPPV